MPRLWMAPAHLMCGKHLAAEHHECHVFLGKLKARHKLDGYIKANLFAAADLWARHETLVTEMERRGFKHGSPFPAEAEVLALAGYLPEHPPVDRAAAEKELRSRGCKCFRG